MSDDDSRIDGHEDADRDNLLNEDEDDTGENELRLVVGDVDADGDGISDGEEDRDLDGEANEDEDDSESDACDGDLDDDGEADEDDDDRWAPSPATTRPPRR